jgi:CRISPR system Cascade subunit CasD
MRVLVLRFDAPLVSFGAPAVDQNGVVQRFPSLSMLTGLLGNALGWDHRDHGALAALQERLRFAARLDRAGEPLVDYQTVFLGADWMVPEKTAWTTHGAIARRAGANDLGTHQRWRHYRADSLTTVVIGLFDGSPSTDELAHALRQPMRPLFIGRKPCLPASRILVRVVEAASLIEALAAEPRTKRSDPGPLAATWWHDEPADGAHGESVEVPVSDERDWRNRVHVGRRLMRIGRVNPAETTHA